MPYLSRILMPAGIGKITYANSIIQYFVYFAMLGIPLYGVREIAKVKNDKSNLSRVLSELLSINLVMIILSYILFTLFYIFNDTFRSEPILFLVLSLSIVFTTLGVEWFYIGVEEFRYITVRVVIVRIICLVMMFLFVKDISDYIISALITVLGNVGGNLYNFYNVKSLVKIKEIKFYSIKRHIKPVLISFGMVIATSIYLLLTNIILGSISGSEDLAYYSQASKLIQICIVFVTSLGSVMIPRISFFIEENRQDEYIKLLKTLFSFNMFVSLPIAGILITLSHRIVVYLFGISFASSAFPLRIMAINLIVVALSNILGQQILYPNNKDKLVMTSVFAGAIINVLFNFILIPRYSYIGASISLLLTEVIVLILRFIFSYKYINKSVFTNLYKYVISLLTLIVYLNLIKGYISNIVTLIFHVLFALIIFVICNLVFKDEMLLSQIEAIKKIGIGSENE